MFLYRKCSHSQKLPEVNKGTDIGETKYVSDSEEDISENDVDKSEITNDKSIYEKNIKDFFNGIFGTDVTEESLEDVEPKKISQILEIPNESDVSKETVDAISKMNINELSKNDKDLIFDTTKQHISNKYRNYMKLEQGGDLAENINISSTQECKAEYEKYGDTYDERIVGFYDPNTKQTFIDAERNETSIDLMATAEHEVLHKASNGGMYGAITDITGRKTYNPNLCVGLDEGITEMLAIEDMKDMGFDYTSDSYPNEVSAARLLCDAMGDDIVKKAYFGNNPNC